MIKTLSILAALAVVFCGMLLAGPQRFMAALGTNTVVEFDVDRAFQLVDVTATVDGVATNGVVVSRIWTYSQFVIYDQVVTNLYGTVETNSIKAGPIPYEITNEVYDASSDTLPTPYVFLVDEVVQVTASVTNAIIRIVGSDE
jgi:hypothetical protein